MIDLRKNNQPEVTLETLDYAKKSPSTASARATGFRTGSCGVMRIKPVKISVLEAKRHFPSPETRASGLLHHSDMIF